MSSSSIPFPPFYLMGCVNANILSTTCKPLSVDLDNYLIEPPYSHLAGFLFRLVHFASATKTSLGFSLSHLTF